MAFDGEGWVTGVLRGLLYGEDAEFEGNSINDEGCDVVEAREVWDDFARKAYGRG